MVLLRYRVQLLIVDVDYLFRRKACLDLLIFLVRHDRYSRFFQKKHLRIRRDRYTRLTHWLSDMG